MDFAYTEEMQMLRDTAQQYADDILVPNAARWDADESFPEEGIAAAAELGFCGIQVAEEYGGVGLGNLEQSVILEEINRGCASTGITLAVHNSLICGPISKYGTEDQRQRYLPQLAAGERIGAYAVTEPGAGSDAAAMRMRADKVKGGYKLTGTKAFITTGDRAGLVVVFAVTDSKAKKGRGISAFLVEPDFDGFSVGKHEEKCGIRGSSTVEIVLDSCFVPRENLLGELNRGFPIALDTLDGGRIGVASQSLGIARACLEASIKYSKEREQFGRPIGDFQAVQWKLADMATSLDAARLLTHRASWLRDQGEPCSKEAAMAKLTASRAANRAADEAVQIHGGAGYTKEFPVERYFRDARITEIYEGVTDIQRLVISRNLLR